MRIVLALSLAAALLTVGCQEEKPASVMAASPGSTAPPRTASLPPRAESGTPQPKLQTVKVWVGTNEITAEIASTLSQIQTGMMWRTNMAEMEGMLFVMPQAQQVSFYMRNTLLPLSCAYIDPEGRILEIYDMKPRDETPVPSKADNILYVLEMNQGWFARHNVGPGMLLTTQYGSFSQTFRRR